MMADYSFTKDRLSLKAAFFYHLSSYTIHNFLIASRNHFSLVHNAYDIFGMMKITKVMINTILCYQSLIFPNASCHFLNAASFLKVRE